MDRRVGKASWLGIGDFALMSCGRQISLCTVSLKVGALHRANLAMTYEGTAVGVEGLPGDAKVFDFAQVASGVE